MRETLSLSHIVANVNHLDYKCLGLLPGEVLVCEVSILGSLEVDWLGQVELLNYHTRSHIEVLVDDSNELIRGEIRCTVAVDEDGEWLGDTNGVRKLDKRTAAKLSIYQRLCDPTSEVRS